MIASRLHLNHESMTSVYCWPLRQSRSGFLPKSIDCTQVTSYHTAIPHTKVDASVRRCFLEFVSTPGSRRRPPNLCNFVLNCTSARWNERPSISNPGAVPGQLTHSSVVRMSEHVNIHSDRSLLDLFLRPGVRLRSVAHCSRRGSAEDALGPETAKLARSPYFDQGPQPSSLPLSGGLQPLQAQPGSQLHQRRLTINSHSRTNALNIVNDLLKRVGVSSMVNFRGMDPSNVSYVQSTLFSVSELLFSYDGQRLKSGALRLQELETKMATAQFCM